MVELEREGKWCYRKGGLRGLFFLLHCNRNGLAYKCLLCGSETNDALYRRGGKIMERDLLHRWSHHYIDPAEKFVLELLRY
jgi:hypothetical protein